jgi:hypothetical protein
MHAAGLRPILLKGIHTGSEFFPDPAVRPSSDIDILLTAEERQGAETVLKQLGFVETRAVVADRADWAHRDAPTELQSVELDHADNPWTVDLHEALQRFYFRGTSADLGRGMFDTRRTIDLDGEPVRVLEQPYLVTFLALHTGCDLGAVRLVRLFELVAVIRADVESRRLDWGDVTSLLDETRTGRFVYPALELAEELAPGTVARPLLDRLERDASPRMRGALEAVRLAGMGPLGERSFDAKLAWAHGPKEFVMALSELGLPSLRDSLAATLAQRLSVARWRIARRLRRGPTRP